MKYVMFEIDEGQKLFFVFFDVCIYVIMVEFMWYMLVWWMSLKVWVVLVGFVSVGIDVQVYGEFEFFGGFKVCLVDVVWIIVGESIVFMLDVIVEMMFEWLKVVDISGVMVDKGIEGDVI